MEQADRAADDMALAAFIDNELPDADAERLRVRLRNDAWLARRLIAMSQATAVIRLAYRDAIDVVAAVAASYWYAVREVRGESSRNWSASGPYDEGRPAPLREVALGAAA